MIRPSKYRSDTRCPVAIQESLRAYVEGRSAGGFLRAVLENDLAEAVRQADHTTSQCLPAILGFVYDWVPADIWGSREAVAEHLRVSAEARK